jgi:hypothetical protein
MIKAAIEIAIAPPTTPPTRAPTLEEEPLDPDDEEWAEATGRMAVDPELSIFVSGPASGVSEKETGSVRRPREEGKRWFLPPTVRDKLGSQVPLTWDIQSICSENER